MIIGVFVFIFIFCVNFGFIFDKIYVVGIGVDNFFDDICNIVKIFLF